MRALNIFLAVALPAVLVATVAASRAEESRPVPFPDTYRSWQLVKSIVVGPESPLFSKRGGIHHYYANELAVSGYQTGKFPAGSIIVDEAVATTQGEGLAKGILLEERRRFLEVMEKYDDLYADTAGWGFQRFEGEEHEGQLTESDQTHCFECHENAKDHDHVFSRIRP